ncbi:hypothetical protein LIER_13510 [Lithospermum erythrorhizon]|uniref:Uncharacterized protein n=1 Tax=Lithospermum erythrorhizon TaxID=34254 RepID=A0AAV3PWJ5_LITER
MGPFAWATLTAFQVGCLSVGVTPNLILFSEMFNVLYQGVLSYFQIQSRVVNMLYFEKPGKANPNSGTGHRHREDVNQPNSGSEENYRPRLRSLALRLSLRLWGPQALHPKKSNLLPRTSPKFFTLDLSEPCLDESLRFQEVRYPPLLLPSLSGWPIRSGEGYKSDHHFFVNTPYVIPLGVQATEAGYTMFLKWQKAIADAEELEREKSSFGNLLSQMREERVSAIVERNRVVEKYNGLMTSHAASEGKLKAEMGALLISRNMLLLSGMSM